MKKNKNKEKKTFYSSEQLCEKNAPDRNMVFLVLALFLVALNLFPGHRHTLQKNPAPVPNTFSEKYLWFAGFPEIPTGLHHLTPGQLKNDFADIASLLEKNSAANSVISAVQYQTGILKSANLPPEVADIFFLEIPINRADENILTSLPGIGPVLAAKIKLRRDQHGPFRSKKELLQINGIGPKKFSRLVDRITLD